MKTVSIDINCDVGEGYDNEADIFPFISSCNIACGGHAGDENTMQNTIRLAKLHQLKIGAHPSFPDKKNFGRKVLAMDNKALLEALKQQMFNFIKIANNQRVILNHVKLHGALYNLAAIRKDIATAVINLMQYLPKETVLYAPYNSVLAAFAKKEKINLAIEAFIDRRYNANLTLVSREQNHALIVNRKEAYEQLINMVLKKSVITINRKATKLEAQTYCIHGDNPQILQILKFLNKELSMHNIVIQRNKDV